MGSCTRRRDHTSTPPTSTLDDTVPAKPSTAGRPVILEREHDVVAEFAGALTGAYRPSELDELRSEWD